MFQRAQRLLDTLLAEFKHHADPVNHQPVFIAPAKNAGARMVMLVTGGFGLLMIPVAAAVPMLPIWPFALTLIVALARSSARFRFWLSHNRAFHTMMSIIRTRPERVFRLANRAMTWLLGSRDDDSHNRHA